jgi:transmembrane sensor
MSAADWVARLSGEPVEADWLAFEAWLAAPGHRASYDKALALWLDIDRQAEPLAAAIADLRAPTRKAAVRPFAGFWLGGATVAAVAVSLFGLNARQAAQVSVYSTAKSEHRVIALADGSRITLNGGSQILVRLERGRRDVTLARGEAAFDVFHDPNRPFSVQVGDQTLRDIGTEFNVLRANGDIVVTVRQGMVDVGPSDGRPGVPIGAGRQMLHHEGANASKITSVIADDAFAWQARQLIYRNQRLAQIAADLNRYGDDTVKVDGAAADLRFSGVISIDGQQLMVRRLAALLPISQNRKDGVITLHGVDGTR